MQKKEVKKIFNLEGYILDKFEEKNNEIILHCHIQKKIMKLKSERSKIINQSKNRKIAHLMFEDKKVFISIKQRRFYFPKHNQKLWELLPQIKKNQQMTTIFKKKLCLI